MATWMGCGCFRVLSGVAAGRFRVGAVRCRAGFSTTYPPAPATMKMNTIALGLKGKTDLEIAQALRDTAQRLTDNAADFPNPLPSAADFVAGAQAIEDAITANNVKQQEATVTTAAKNGAVAAGRGLLTDGAGWARQKVKDAATLAKVYPLKKAPSATTDMGQVHGLALDFGAQPGWLAAAWQTPGAAVKSFEVQVKLPGAADFTHCKTVSAASVTLKGLPSGQTVQVRVRAIGPKGLEGAWSDGAAHLVP